VLHGLVAQEADEESDCDDNRGEEPLVMDDAISKTRRQRNENKTSAGTHVSIAIVALAVSMMPLAQAQYFRGVNVSGAEFGQSQLPGTFGHDYTFQSESTFRYFAGRNLDLVRFPIQWERIQPVSRGPLDAAYLGLLKQAIGWSRAHGVKFILDVHNFARYYGNVAANPADLADLWARLSAEFRDEPGVYAYDIMNEPHDMGNANWKTISQAVLNAIRANGDQKLVMIPGDSWSSAYRWVTTHGSQAWITDPANNFLYEAHEYFDSDESGTYALSYDLELQKNPNLANIGPTRLAPFVSWCTSNKVRGYLGEYGIPNSDPRWLTVLDKFLTSIDQAGFPGTYWAGGEWWGNYALSVQPLNNFTGDRVQLPVLSAHLAPGAFTSVSAVSFQSVWGSGANGAPDSLMSGFGTGLALVNEIDLLDTAGGIATALPIYVSALQINYAVPGTLGPGHYVVQAKSAGTVVASGNLELDAVAPAMFAGGEIVRVHPDGSQTVEEIVGPVNLGPATDRVFVQLYGSGIRRAKKVALQIEGTAIGVAYSGPQGGFAGLDQINAELPRTLAGAGKTQVVVTADGIPANPLTLTFE
jgi:uncharacterized protein (TIGR03437 family)